MDARHADATPTTATTNGGAEGVDLSSPDRTGSSSAPPELSCSAAAMELDVLEVPENFNDEREAWVRELDLSEARSEGKIMSGVTPDPGTRAATKALPGACPDTIGLGPASEAQPVPRRPSSSIHSGPRSGPDCHVRKRNEFVRTPPSLSYFVPL